MSGEIKSENDDFSLLEALKYENQEMVAVLEEKAKEGKIIRII